MTRDERPALRLLVDGRWSSLAWILGVGGLLAAALAVPWRGECGFRYALGAPCPGCGMTRALLALLEGRVGESLLLHPLALPLALGTAVLVAMAVREGVTGRRGLRALADRRAGPVAVLALVLLGGVWLVRVVLRPDWSPDPLRPGSVAERLLR